jgi:hypothetical protein
MVRRFPGPKTRFFDRPPQHCTSDDLADRSAALASESREHNQRTVTKLADGIYEIRHKDAPDTFPQGNPVVIIGDMGVLESHHEF